MAARERQTASYAAVPDPYATLTDRAAIATRHRGAETKIDRKIAIDVSIAIAADPEHWQCARATDQLGEEARIRRALSRT